VSRAVNLRRAASVSFLAALACIAASLLAGPAAAEPAPTSTQVVYAAGRIVPIPASIPHEEGDMVDRRIVPDLRWIAAHYPIYITDGYSGPLPNGEWVGCHGCHATNSDHTVGLAADIVPAEPSSTCDSHWTAITRLARWAEPQQNKPVPPFRWVGYNGDAGHGCGNHLHLSWNHAPASEYTLAQWVEVFPVSASGIKPSAAGKKKSAPKPPPPPGPSGGIAQVSTGGVSASGTGD
jgi:hypothetical protein